MNETIKNEVLAMAEAHLKNVANAINDLEREKLRAEEEIVKLKQYIEDGIENIKKFKNATFSDDVSISNRKYLGD